MIRYGKPASIGVAVRRWVTMHGFAFNVANDLSYFELIHPCGLKNVAMTSLSVLLGRPVDVQEAAEKVERRFGEVFRVQVKVVTPEEVLNGEFSGRAEKPGA